MWIFHRTWWRHQMETFSALLAICAGNSPVPGEFPTQRPVTRSFDVYFDLRLNKRLYKQSWGWWFVMLLCPLWRHSNDIPNLNPLKRAKPTCILIEDGGRTMGSFTNKHKCKENQLKHHFRNTTLNTLRPRQMDAISQTTFSNAFSWMKMFEFRLKFHWSLFPGVQLTIFQHWFR